MQQSIKSEIQEMKPKPLLTLSTTISILCFSAAYFVDSLENFFIFTSIGFVSAVIAINIAVLIFIKWVEKRI